MEISLGAYMSLDHKAVQQVWPFAPPIDPGGTRAEVHQADGQVSINLGIDITHMPRGERKRLLKDAVAVRWKVLPPLLVWLVTMGDMVCDFPFSAGCNPEAWRTALREALRSDVPPLINVVLVREGIIQRVHTMKSSPTTGPAIAMAMDNCAAPISEAVYNKAVDDYQARYRPADLLKLATVVRVI